MSPAIDTVERFFAALEAGDLDTLAAIYTPDARIWHNYEAGDQPASDNLRTLRVLHRVVEGMHYEIVRRAPAPGGVFQQHVLRGRLPGGAEVAIPAAMFLAVSGGRISRIEEYLDPAQAAPVGAAIAAAPTR